MQGRVQTGGREILSAEALNKVMKTSVSAKEAMFLLADVCLFVCWQIYRKTTRFICIIIIIFLTVVRFGPRKKPLNFGSAIYLFVWLLNIPKLKKKIPIGYH